MMRINQQKTQRNLLILSFTMVPVSLLLLFAYYPAVKLVVYSFSNFDGFSQMENVGFRNWKMLLSSAEVWQSLGHSFYYIIGGVVQNCLGLFMAVILNKKQVKGRAVFRGIIFLPFVLNSTAVSFLFRYFYDYTKGPINMLLKSVGLPPVYWLSNPSIVNWSLAFVCLWKYTGYIMVLYLAALQSIPSEYYEAAEIDGCGPFGQFIYITLPQISNVIKLQMFLNISGAVNIFDIPFVITKGGPNGASKTLAMMANEYAFDFSNFGMASAYGIFCTVIIAVLYITQNKLLYKKER